jgi:para-nitrobenzyl esterase
MVEPSLNLAELTAKAGQPAYFYRFSYVAKAQRGKVQGATHGSEILYAFDGVAWTLKEKARAADLAMGRTASDYWAAFVLTGDPNGDGRPEWPRYDPAARSVLNFTNTGVTVGADPLQARLDLWRSVWDQSR